MRITKFGHACIRVEHDGHTVVIDPGGFTQPEAVDGADAVLITHEHPDHYDPAHLARTDAPVFTIEAVAAKIREDAPALAERITVVAPEETFRVDGEGGLSVRAVGEAHVGLGVGEQAGEVAVDDAEAGVGVDAVVDRDVARGADQAGEVDGF